MKKSPLLVVALTASLLAGCENPEHEKLLDDNANEIARLKEEVKTLEGKNARLERDSFALKQKLKQIETEQKKKNLANVREDLGVAKNEKLFATFKTSMGDIVVQLFVDEAPLTVKNFVELAEGKKEWLDPKTRQKTSRPLYDGTIFHRVIPDFMIQGGDPLGTGRGGPGYRFEDEFHPELRHDRPGRLSMANSGRNTNGSQFFITEKPTPHLDNRHSIFGQVTEGLDLVPKITRVEKKTASPRDARPAQDIVLERVVIGRGAPGR
jgi:peptidyl-prolyl cis-trans isomerase A (cyclophilin A)